MAKKERKKRDPASNIAGGHARAEQLSAEERSTIAKMGAKARFQSLTPRQRSELATKAINERWRKHRERNGLT